MSTENTQTAEAPQTAGASAENTSSTQLGESSQQQSSASPTSMDALKKVAAASADNFQPKSVDEAIAETQKPVVPAFTPNYKYKALLEEKEVEEFWRPLMKDEESAKKVIDVMTKLDGFSHVKSSREKLAQEFNSLQNDYQAQNQVVQRVESALQRGDLSSVFRQLGVRPEDIYRWTHDQLNRMELPPEQRKAFEEAEALRAQQFDVQEQMAQYQRMYEDQAVQARTVHLDLVLSRQDVAKASESWDKLMGQTGAFRDLVIQEAQNRYYQTGQDLSAEQAVHQVMQKFGKVMSGQMSPQALAPQAPGEALPHAQSPQVTQPQAKPVIPNVNGKGAAPIKKVPKSLDDLKKLQKEMALAGE